MQGTYVQIFGSVHDGKNQHHDCIGLRTDEHGRFEASGLHPDLDHVVLVRRDGYATLVYALPPVNQAGVKVAGQIQLARPRIVSGVVYGPDDKPRPHTKVCLWGFNADCHRLDPDGMLAKTSKQSRGRAGWGLIRMYVGKREVRTDHRGRFAFGDVPPGEFHCVVYDTRNGKIGSSERFEIEAEEDPQPIEIGTSK